MLPEIASDSLIISFQVIDQTSLFLSLKKCDCLPGKPGYGGDQAIEETTDPNRDKQMKRQKVMRNWYIRDGWEQGGECRTSAVSGECCQQRSDGVIMVRVQEQRELCCMDLKVQSVFNHPNNIHFRLCFKVNIVKRVTSQAFWIMNCYSLCVFLLLFDVYWVNFL